MGPYRSHRTPRLATIVLAIFAGLFPAILHATPAHADTVRLAGSLWLGGAGVDVLGDGNNTWNYVTNINGVSTQSGYKWQCVELINRLYLARGWITERWTGNGDQLYDHAPATLAKEPNGSVSYLSPGDVVAFHAGAPNGHVAIVDSVSGNTVTLVNQNATNVYTSITLTGGTLSNWAGYSVEGVIHAPSADTATTSRLKGDFNGDGKGDLAVLHRNPDDGINVNVLWGHSSPPLNGAALAVQLPASQGWRWSNVKAAAADYNGSGTTDIAILHRNPDNTMNVHVLWGSPNGPLTGRELVRQLGPGWNWHSSIASSGDFDGDGRADLAVLHRNPDEGINVNVLWGYANPPLSHVTLATTLPGNQGWRWSHSKAASADYNGGGATDIAILHRNPDNTMNVHIVWGSQTDPALSGRTFIRQLGPGWNWHHSIPVAGNYDGDGRADLAVLHRNPDDGINVNVLWGYTNPPLNNVALAVQLPGNQGWRWSHSKAASADYNASGTTDIAILHRNPDNTMNVHILWGSPNGPLTGRELVCQLGSGWNWHHSIPA